jgi:hypothetical protein
MKALPAPEGKTNATAAAAKKAREEIGELQYILQCILLYSLCKDSV